MFLKFFESTVRCTSNGTEELIGPTNYFLSRQSSDMKPLPSGNTPAATMVLLWTPSLPNLFTLVLWCKRIWILNISSALKVSSSSGHLVIVLTIAFYCKASCSGWFFCFGRSYPSQAPVWGTSCHMLNIQKARACIQLHGWGQDGFYAGTQLSVISSYPIPKPYKEISCFICVGDLNDATSMK